MCDRNFARKVHLSQHVASIHEKKKITKLKISYFLETNKDTSLFYCFLSMASNFEPDFESYQMK